MGTLFLTMAFLFLFLFLLLLALSLSLTMLPLLNPLCHHLTTPTMPTFKEEEEEEGKNKTHQPHAHTPISQHGLPQKPTPDFGFPTPRPFRAHGSAAYLFVEFGTYRGGPDSFAVIGLASKPIHVFGKPTFECQWIPSNSNSDPEYMPIVGTAIKMLPDWGYGRVYTVVVVNCSFPRPVGGNGNGGRLVLCASPGQGHGHSQSFVALQENPGDYYRAHASSELNAYPYEFVYCGSPLYGTVNPDRIREWVAYHASLFGPRSLMVLYDAGGAGRGVRSALAPWVRSGRVTIENVRQQELYDGYYYNQFLIANDCLHRARPLARWAFFFDVDEYLYISPKETLQSVMAELSNYTQITYEQAPMSDQLCLAKDKSRTRRQWGFEKLVFRNVKKKFRWDRKYVIQPWAAMATGVHMSENIVGRTLHSSYPKLKYYHYHNTINNLRELCKVYVRLNSTRDTFYYAKEPYRLDKGMHTLAKAVKRFQARHLRSPRSVQNGTA